MDVSFFDSASEFRRWLEAHHDTATEVWVGFYKKSAQRPGIIYGDAVDQALCFGWIDGIRKSIDQTSYTNRFTPRRRGSIWSAVNTRRVGELTDLGLMHPSGLAVFAERDQAKSGLHSFEQESHDLGDEYEAIFRKNAAAWKFFQAQPPSYRRTAIWWVVSAKREETRRRRLTTLIDDSENGRRIAGLARPAKG